MTGVNVGGVWCHDFHYRAYVTQTSGSISHSKLDEKTPTVASGSISHSKLDEKTPTVVFFVSPRNNPPPVNIARKTKKSWEAQEHIVGWSLGGVALIG